MKFLTTLLMLIVFQFSGKGVLSAEVALVPVAVELVLALDNSSSVDAREFELQRQGIAKAFVDADVIETIENLKGGVAVAVYMWGEKARARVVIPFVHLYDARSAKAFAFRISVSPRPAISGYTALGHAMIESARMLEENSFKGLRRVIDISGDGRNNNGLSPQAARAGVVALGITINGLPILSDDDELDRYFRNRVIGGPLSFIEPAVNYDAFGQAIIRKLLREFQIFIAKGPARSFHLVQK